MPSLITMLSSPRHNYGRTKTSGRERQWRSTTHCVHKPIKESTRTLLASWHREVVKFFTPGLAGMLCCAMLLANIVRASVLTPHAQYWYLTSTNTLDDNMLEGELIYRTIRQLSVDYSEPAYPIQQNSYREIRNSDVIRRPFLMFDNTFYIEYNESATVHGSHQDKINPNNIEWNCVYRTNAISLIIKLKY